MVPMYLIQLDSSYNFYYNILCYVMEENILKILSFFQYKAASRRLSVKRLLFTVLFVFLFIVTVANCSNIPQKDCYIQYSENQVYLNGQPAEKKTSLVNNSTIVTSKSSFCIISNTNSLIVPYSNTIVTFDKIPQNKKEPYAITIEKGIIDFSFDSLQTVIISGPNYLFEGEVELLRCFKSGDVADLWFAKAKGTFRYFSSKEEIVKNIVNKTRITLFNNSIEYNSLHPEEVEELLKVSHLKIDGKINEELLFLIKDQYVVLGDSNVKEVIYYGLLKYKKGPLQIVITKHGTIYKGYVIVEGKSLIIESYDSKKIVPQHMVKYVLQYNPILPIDEAKVKRL